MQLKRFWTFDEIVNIKRRTIMSIYEKSLNDYLEVASSNSPTPGGGSVSAITATNAAAMVSMVCNLTIGKKGYDDVQDNIKEILVKSTALIEKLKEQTTLDMSCFDAFMGALRLPKDTDEQKETRKEALQQAYKKATDVPMSICELCLEIVRLANELAPIGNKGAISDVGVGALIAEAALRACMLSVDINLPGIKDTAYVEDVRARRAMMISEADELKDMAVAKVRERL